MEDHNNNQIVLESLSPVLQRVIAMMLIHDMLPWDMDEQGMTLTEIRQRLARLGIARTPHTLNRDLSHLMSVARIHYDEEHAVPRRYHRFHHQRLTDGLPEPVRQLAAPVLGLPDWPSDIQVRR